MAVSPYVSFSFLSYCASAAFMVRSPAPDTTVFDAKRREASTIIPLNIKTGTNINVRSTQIDPLCFPQNNCIHFPPQLKQKIFHLIKGFSQFLSLSVQSQLFQEKVSHVPGQIHISHKVRAVDCRLICRRIDRQAVP